MSKVQQKYQYPVVAVDVVLFTIEKGHLKVLLIKMNKEPYLKHHAIPGGLINADESLEEGARRLLSEKIGFSDIYLEQLRAFGEVKRDPFGRVVSISFLGLLPEGRVEDVQLGDRVEWFSINDVPKLAYDHQQMFQIAYEYLKAKIASTNIACGLLPIEFSFPEMKHVFEVILERKFEKRNFRKKILSAKLIKKTGKKQYSVPNRPAELYTFKSHEAGTIVSFLNIKT